MTNSNTPPAAGGDRSPGTPIAVDIPALGGDLGTRTRLLRETIPSWITVEGGEIHAEGVPLRSLADAFGTPGWIVSLSCLEENYRRLDAAVSRYRPTELAYSVKANNNRAVIETLAAAGSFFDCSSEFEMWAALRAGVAAERLILNGSGKSASFLERAVEVGVRQINLDSHDEALRVGALAAQASRPVNCVLRIRPDYSRLLEQDPTYDMTLRIGEGKFGIAVEGGEALAAARFVAEHPGLRLLGLSHHAGFPGYRVPFTRAAQLLHHRECIRSMCEFAGLMLEELGVEVEVINAGGGLRSGTRVLLVAPGQSEDAEVPELPSAEEYGRNLDAALADHLPEGLNPTLQLECGGYIVMDAVALLTTVVEVKDEPSPRRWVNVDAHMMQFASRGMTRIGSPVIHSGSQAGRPFDDIPVDLVGQTCNYDALAEGLRMAPVAPEDLLLLPQHGAYMEVSGTQFNAFPRPAVVAVRGDEAALARRRETVEDVFARDSEIPAALRKSAS